MRSNVGIPLEGVCSEAPNRERASATPARPTNERACSGCAPRKAAQQKPLSLPLAALQEWFAAAVLHPGGIGASLRESAATRDARLGEDDVERLVLPSPALSGAERVQIYRQAYRARLVECLADDYPAVQHALGEDAFETLCRAYIDGHPSQSPSLNFYGRGFAAFLQASSHPLASFAADLSALEWALVEVLHAASAERLSSEALSAVPVSSWAFARFVPSATVRLLELAYPANGFFQAFRQGETPSVPEPAWSATAVFREGPTLWRMDLSRPMHALLRALFAGRALGDAVEGLVAEQGEQEASEIMSWFQNWVKHGFFAKIVVLAV
jgi:hypothetical protein